MASNSIRIVVVDSYMSHQPIQGLDVMYSEFRSAAVSHLPVLRCFGSTAEGRKICVHIHGVFPYFYIPYDGTGDSKTLMYQIASNIDRAVNISLNQASSNSHHVYKISLVSGIPMYGYHSRNHQFFKIHLYNPMLLTRVCNLLRSDSILGQFYQPHESHINYHLQFMIDYNLHGMSTMEVTNMRYRVNPHDLNDESIPREHCLPPNVHRTASCELEADVLAENIVNREEIASGALAANPGIATLWEDERQRRRNKAEDSQMGQFLELTRTNINPTKSHLVFKKALLERLAILSTDEKVQLDETEPQNLSVYPAETPQDSNIQNASMLEAHRTPSSLDDSSIILSLTPQEEDESQSMEVTLDENAMKLLQILEELEANVREEEARDKVVVESDSILSQTVIEEDKVTEDQEQLHEGELDLSMPLEAVTTPRKVINTSLIEIEESCEGNNSSEDIFNSTLVPQLDGQHDLEELKDWGDNKEFFSCVGDRMSKDFGSKEDVEGRKLRNKENREQKVKIVAEDMENIQWFGRLRHRNFNVDYTTDDNECPELQHIQTLTVEDESVYGSGLPTARNVTTLGDLLLDHDHLKSPPPELNIKPLFVKIRRLGSEASDIGRTYLDMPILTHVDDYETEIESKESDDPSWEPVTVQRSRKNAEDTKANCRKTKSMRKPKEERPCRLQTRRYINYKEDSSEESVKSIERVEIENKKDTLEAVKIFDKPLEKSNSVYRTNETFHKNKDTDTDEEANTFDKQLKKPNETHRIETISDKNKDKATICEIEIFDNQLEKLNQMHGKTKITHRNEDKNPLEEIKICGKQLEKSNHVHRIKKKCKSEDKNATEEIKIFGKQMEKLSHIHRIKKVSRKIRLKEAAFLKIPRPKFNIISPDKYADLRSNQPIVIDQLLEQTQNHVDPNLHLILKYPNNDCFLYLYKGNFYPEVISVPPESDDRCFKVLMSTLRALLKESVNDNYITVRGEFDEAKVSENVEGDRDNKAEQAPRKIGSSNRLIDSAKNSNITQKNQEKLINISTSSINSMKGSHTAKRCGITQTNLENPTKIVTRSMRNEKRSYITQTGKQKPSINAVRAKRSDITKTNKEKSGNIAISSKNITHSIKTVDKAQKFEKRKARCQIGSKKSAISAKMSDITKTNKKKSGNIAISSKNITHSIKTVDNAQKSEKRKARCQIGSKKSAISAKRSDITKTNKEKSGNIAISSKNITHIIKTVDDAQKSGKQKARCQIGSKKSAISAKRSDITKTNKDKSGNVAISSKNITHIINDAQKSGKRKARCQIGSKKTTLVTPKILKKPAKKTTLVTPKILKKPVKKSKTGSADSGLDHSSTSTLNSPPTKPSDLHKNKNDFFKNQEKLPKPKQLKTSDKNVGQANRVDNDFHTSPKKNPNLYHEEFMQLEQYVNEYKLKPKPKNYEITSHYIVVDNFSKLPRRSVYRKYRNSIFENMQESVKIFENKPSVKPAIFSKNKRSSKILPPIPFKLKSSYKIPKKMENSEVEHTKVQDLPRDIFEPNISDEHFNVTSENLVQSYVKPVDSEDVVVISSSELNLNIQNKENTTVKRKKLKQRKSLDEIHYKHLEAVGMRKQASLLKAYRKKVKVLKLKKACLGAKTKKEFDRGLELRSREIDTVQEINCQTKECRISNTRPSFDCNTSRKAKLCDNNNIKVTVSNIIPLTQKVPSKKCVVNWDIRSKLNLKKQGTKRAKQNDNLINNTEVLQTTPKRIKLNRDMFKVSTGSCQNQNNVKVSANKKNFYIFSKKYLNTDRKRKSSRSTKDLFHELNEDLDSHKQFLRVSDNFPQRNQDMLSTVHIYKNENIENGGTLNNDYPIKCTKYAESYCTSSFDFLADTRNDIFSRDTELDTANDDSDRTTLSRNCKATVNTVHVLGTKLNDVSNIQRKETSNSVKSEEFISAESTLEDGFDCMVDATAVLDANLNDVSSFNPKVRLYSEDSNEMLYGKRVIEDNSRFVVNTTEILNVNVGDVSSLEPNGLLYLNCSNDVTSYNQMTNRKKLQTEKGVQTDTTEIVTEKNTSENINNCDTTNSNKLMYCDKLLQTEDFSDNRSINVKNVSNSLAVEEVQEFGGGAHGLGDNSSGVLLDNCSFIDALNLEVQSPSVGLKGKKRLILKRILIPALDGAYDTDSSESSDQSSPKNRRKRKKLSKSNYSQKNSSKYKPLSICSIRSPRVSEKSIASHMKIKEVQNPIVGIMEKSKEAENTTKNITEPKSKSKIACDIDAVKRKINFPDLRSSVSSTTIVEEKISCIYSPSKTATVFSVSSQKSYPKTIVEVSTKNNNVTADATPLIVEESTKTSQTCKQNNGTPIQKPINEESTTTSQTSKQNNGTPSQKPRNSDEDIFTSSDSDDNSKASFFTNNLNMTIAEMYDLESNYRPKEGCSTVFTPEEPENLPLSASNSNQMPSSEHVDAKGITQVDSSEAAADDRKQLPLSGSKSNESSSLDFLTPYQKDPTEKIEDTHVESSDTNVVTEECLDETLTESEVDKTLKSTLTVLKPTLKPPTFEEVENSLDQYNIPHVKEQEPFYSNPEDVTGSVEVGFNVLKIASKTTAHLPEFHSQNDSLNTLRKRVLEHNANLKWNLSNVKHLKLSYCQHRDIIITPVCRPPSYEEVASWLEEKNSNVDVDTPEQPKSDRIKIHVPLSPTGENYEDMDISLSISPCGTPSQPEMVRKASQPELIKKASQSETSDASSSPVLNKSKKLKQLRENKTKFSKESTQNSSRLNQSCQITGVMANNSFGFDRSVENLQNVRAVVSYQYLTTLAMELHIRTRGDLKPNPEYDSIRVIFYSIFNDVPEDFCKSKTAKGILAISSLPVSPGSSLAPILNGTTSDSVKITYVDSEEDLINQFVELLECCDPDILAGYEIQMLSWGYLVERASVLSINLLPLLGRSKVSNKFSRENEETDLEKVTGRVVLDVWRLMRHEIALQSYTFESVVYHILHKRVPMYSFKDLSFWWDHRTMLHRHRTVKYYLYRVDTLLELFDKLDLINRTSELARLFGIQFYEVLSRGSQFRVESMMLRLAKPLNFIPVSPSVQQRAKMRAPEYIPLVMEPESRLYNDPVIVLDFQSLYPSIIIAYNYCFTTCLGRVEFLGKNTPFEFGATQLKVSSKRVERLVKKDLLNFSPCGVAFVKNKVRGGILPRMLREILDTRLMVKSAMKENKDDEVLQKVLHNRQLGLKLIANVTYGYTAANFSGRMCCVEVGDSVVSKGRETLQRAIAMVDGTPEWGARVVYGDTDSLFVSVPGKTREVAFEIGKKIAQAVTDANPDPIKLKLEKVYQPCILQTKKRYVGYMYESPDQKEPVYDAKGIETVRRDGCPAVSKMLEKCLRILFEQKDVSLIKKYVLRQFNKIMAGRVSIQDLTFAKEYRGFSGYKQGACVPSLELARKWTAVDKRNEPRCGERVPYVIVNGPPGLPLIRLVRSPRDLLADPALRPNALYYITKVIIPPINRCFNLIGADLNNWFNQMPRKQMQSLPNSCSPASGRKSTISQYFATTSCVSCSEQTQSGLCEKCVENPQVTLVILMEKLRNWERNYQNVVKICHCCTGSLSEEIECISLDCPVLYRRIQTQRDLKQSAYVRQLISANFQIEKFF